MASLFMSVCLGPANGRQLGDVYSSDSVSVGEPISETLHGFRGATLRATITPLLFSPLAVILTHHRFIRMLSRASRVTTRCRSIAVIQFDAEFSLNSMHSI